MRRHLLALTAAAALGAAACADQPAPTGLDARLLDPRPGQVPHIVARQIRGAVPGEQRCDDDEEDHALHRTRTTAILGTMALPSGAVPAPSVSRNDTSDDPGGWMMRTWRPDPPRSTPVRS